MPNTQIDCEFPAGSKTYTNDTTLNDNEQGPSAINTIATPRRCFAEDNSSRKAYNKQTQEV